MYCTIINCVLLLLQNVGTCGYRPDQDCMTQCRRASGGLPDMCTTAACNPKRPVLTFDRAVIEAGNKRINLLSRTNALLGTYV